MYNRTWCKGYINAVRHGENQKGYRIFLSGPGGTDKSHVVHLIQRDMKQFQSMNQTMCTLKGTTDGIWGDICVLAVGDLYQLPPVGQCPIYMSPQTVHTLNDIAPNGWEKMQLHELTQSMRQKDMKFVNCLNKIHATVPLEGPEEDRMLQACKLKLNPNNENYPCDAMHVYA